MSVADSVINEPRLTPYEWSVALLFSAVLIAIGGWAYFSPLNEADFPPLPPSEATIRIIGAVAKPGDYKWKPGISLEELIEQAELLPTADVRRIRWNRSIRSGEVIRIPARQWITVYVTGAVQHPGALQVPKGTSYRTLLEYLDLLPDADVTGLRKNRRVLSPEICVEVPRRSLSH